MKQPTSPTAAAWAAGGLGTTAPAEATTARLIVAITRRMNPLVVTLHLSHLT